MLDFHDGGRHKRNISRRVQEHHKVMNNLVEGNQLQHGVLSPSFLYSVYVTDEPPPMLLFVPLAQWLVALVL